MVTYIVKQCNKCRSLREQNCKENLVQQNKNYDRKFILLLKTLCISCDILNLILKTFFFCFVLQTLSQNEKFLCVKSSMLPTQTQRIGKLTFIHVFLFKIFVYYFNMFVFT